MFGGQYYEEQDAWPGMPGGGRPNQRFDQYYRCYPVAMMPTERENVNHGGKVILPPSALDKLTRLHISYPMLFELRAKKGGTDKMTHGGVLEFIAEEGRIYLPHWMMNTLLVEPGDLIQVLSADLPRGQFVKLQPQSVAFLDISDPKAVLENALRNYAALSVEDVLSFSYNDSVYEMAVLEVMPKVKGAIGIIETDLEVDFAPPIGYVEPERSKPASTASTRPSSSLGHIGAGAMAAEIGYNAPPTDGAGGTLLRPSDAFSKGGQKLSGKKSKSGTASPAPTPISAPPPASSSSVFKPTSRIINTADLNTGMSKPAPLRLPFGKLFLGYEIKPVKVKEAGEAGAASDGKKKHVFSGSGQTLRSGEGKGSKRKDRDDGASTSGKAKGKEKATGSAGRTLGKANPELIEID